MFKELRRLVPYFKRYSLRYLVGIFSLLLTDAGLLLVPQFMRQAVDLIAGGVFEMAVMAVILRNICLTAAVIGLGRFGWRVLILGASHLIESDIRHELYDRLQGLSGSFYGRHKTGDLMARFTNDINAIRMASSWALIGLLDGIFMTAAVLVILLSEDARMTLITISPLPIITVVFVLLGRLMRERYLKVQEGFARLSDWVQETLSGIRVVKTFVRERSFVGRFSVENEDYVRRGMRMVRVTGILFPAVGLFSGLTTAIFLVLGGRAAIIGALSAGTFTAFLAYLQMLRWPMLGAGFTINLMQRAAASMGRINAVLREVPDIPNGDESVAIKGDIEFRGLSFTYPDSEQPVLRDISVRIPPGGTLGILGRTGAGKTTMAALVPRILDPPPGALFIDGKDVRHYDLQSLRSQIGMVPQDTFLFSSTIRANVGFGRVDLQQEDSERMQELSTIARDLKTFPEGAETMVGERGVTLSGGQKQRIALSRAMAMDPRIVILDDTFSAVDTETEHTILTELLRDMTDRTTILISHRISTLKYADRIAVMDKGQIVQLGTHEQLAGVDGFYREINEIQKLEEQLEEQLEERI